MSASTCVCMYATISWYSFWCFFFRFVNFTFIYLCRRLSMLSFACRQIKLASLSNAYTLQQHRLEILIGKSCCCCFAESYITLDYIIDFLPANLRTHKVLVVLLDLQEMTYHKYKLINVYFIASSSMQFNITRVLLFVHWSIVKHGTGF